MEDLRNDIWQHLSKDGFISFKDFQEILEKTPKSPYHSKFGFSKLIEEFESISIGFRDKTVVDSVNELKEIEDKLSESPNSWQSLIESNELNLFTSYILPNFFFKDQMGFIKGPFENKDFRFQTPSFLELRTNEKWEIKLSSKRFKNANSRNILLAGMVVLNTFYNQTERILPADGMTIRDRTTKMERHFRFDVLLDYLDVKAIKPLKPLSKIQIHELFNNLDNEALWLEYIPPENFVFEGFIIGLISDVTKVEILSIMREMAANEGGKIDHEEDLNYLEVLARSYLNMPDIHFGTLQTKYGPWMENFSWSLLRSFNEAQIRQSIEDPRSFYGRVLQNGQPIIIEDLANQKYLSSLEKKLLEKGFRSLLLAPLRDENEEIISIFELGSKESYRFTQLTHLQIEDFIAIIEMGNNKFHHEMDNSVNLTIQQEFTSIHPSVEWKFRKVASKYFQETAIEGKQSRLDPIVFKNVYPLYGQADIVGSSKQRNKSIKADLTDNLERLYEILIACKDCVQFHLLEIYIEKIKAQLEKFNNGIFVSSDESVVVELLTQKIHPLIRKLSAQFPQLPHEKLNAYFNYLDDDLDIVYRRRKDYEDSVSLINQTISRYLLQEEEKMQSIMPHYFEKYQTDGVEYNMYLGQAILEEGNFHSFYLQDFRLWQLIVMCEITRLVEKNSKEFPVQLTTAQLIFVFNSTLSIRFQLDEKQFDIDGAYNVRYEILKKRIDKAYIKGTEERLTQAGKVSIVWLQEKDRQEYQEYLEYLVLKGYITPEIEDLELEKMQGVEGLKAIRIQVKL